MARYHIETYGCTANRGESHRLERELRGAGHRRVDTPESADVAILNTCTVVETTEHKMLRRAAELREATGDLIVTGCMAIAQGEAFAEAGIDARVRHWDEVPTAVRNGECPTPPGQSRPVLDGVVGILPIARGCMSDCSYCITKFATGRIESPPVAENVQRARELVRAGAAEIRVTGQDTGVYGWDTGERQLPTLLERICAIDGDFRVRLGMANPKGVHGIRDALADVFAANPKLYNFIHLPVQSGSDDVLGDMRRQHQVAEFREVVDTFDDRLDEWTLSTDFVVGFPTETAADHRESMELLEAVRPEKINITRFSKRPGTDAADMHGLNGQVKKNRSSELSARKREIVADVHESMVGTTRDVLCVEPGTDESIKCRDDAYRLIIVPNGDRYGLTPGERTTVTVTEARPMYAFGEPIADSIELA